MQGIPDFHLFMSDTPTMRRRFAGASEANKDVTENSSRHVDEVVWGKTPSGTVFRVPTTYDVLTSLFRPGHAKSHLDFINLSILALQLCLFFALPRKTARVFFLCFFAFWRTAYDAGLGWVLTKQSKKRWIVREVRRRGWLDENKRPRVYRWIRSQLQDKMGKDYSFDDLPLEYNAWLLFRQAVDIILINDFLSYTLFAFTCFRIPKDLSPLLHVLRCLAGLALIAFNIWVKTEAHHVVKDYGWYWGDVFFERGALVFDGVFEMVPHPMYSVGYAGYYGLSLISGSYPVLFASLAAHAAQFAFLVLFENPHIERMYGQRKLMSMRTPVIVSDSPLSSEATRDQVSTATSSSSARISKHVRNYSSDELTPSATEGDTATDTDELMETETEEEDKQHTPRIANRRLSPRPSQFALNDGTSPRRPQSECSQHDLLARYFRKDPIGLRNLDLMRSADAKLVLLVLYALIGALLPPLSPVGSLALHFTHALFWRFFHSFGLGALLRAQSTRKGFVRHYMKHYFYPKNDMRNAALQEAFENWKDFYNLSLCMTYVSFVALAWKTYRLPQTWGAGDQLLRHILGALLIALHLWTAIQSYNVLGVFGWFFGDFFIEDYPAALDYTGIYRYLNNPERTMSGAAFFGLALISGSKWVFALAVISHLSHWWFLSNVEDPHMRKVYGPSLRKEAGLTKTIKRVALNNARILESGAGKHYAPELKRVAKEFRGTFEKVYEDTAEVLEDFLNKSRPKLSEVVQDTKVLLQQSREKLIITRLAHDLSLYDATQYQISFFPIKIAWNAPLNHSPRDWVGLYRVGANQSRLVTRTSSLGTWLPVHEEEWDGDFPVAPGESRPGSVEGVLEFSGNSLSWHTGSYEIRYHHDGKYNVMAIGGPIEVYVSKPESYDFASVRSCLMRIITLCLDSDPSLVPACSAAPSTEDAISEHAMLRTSEDDFRFWSENQARRIATGIKAAFDVEYAYEVILADANVSTLANRILAMRELIRE
ncbi:hypothetical protein BS47DRAFT_1376879 [Hydnum rufescens UP504]|uniref:Phosphatidylethanolamine N-methyltransferase n=1 Tax=Hydnum rufescens UP504 TaxID=1448309 RepID=A0A9P6AVP4_9AGAM|nr:hypothetical protein BS47DRAFT_1376879 [Hydnum rufescens UP504]